MGCSSAPVSSGPVSSGPVSSGPLASGPLSSSAPASTASSLERAERDDLRHLAGDDVALVVALEHLLPRVGLRLLEAERDALALPVDVENLDLDLLPDLEHLGGMVDVAPRQLADVDEAVHAVEIDEGAEVDDVRDRAADD